MKKDSLIINKPPLPLPSRVFLYGGDYGPSDQVRSLAAIGLLYTDGFDIARVYPPGMFDFWQNGVHCATRGGTRWLLFLDIDGRVATGTINADFDFVQAKAYPAGTFGWDWEDVQVAVDGNGELLITNPRLSAPTTIAFGQVEPDGTFIVWWQSEVALEPGLIAGLPHAHAWLTRTQTTSTVSLLHRGTVVGSRTWSETWSGMAVHGDLLAVYGGLAPEGVLLRPHYEVCRVGPDHQITTIADGPMWRDWDPTLSGVDIDTPSGTLLFYWFGIGPNVAEVRLLTERGFTRTAQLGDLGEIDPDLPDASQGLGWQSIAPC